MALDLSTASIPFHSATSQPTEEPFQPSLFSVRSRRSSECTSHRPISRNPSISDIAVSPPPPFFAQRLASPSFSSLRPPRSYIESFPPSGEEDTGETSPESPTPTPNSATQPNPQDGLPPTEEAPNGADGALHEDSPSSDEDNIEPRYFVEPSRGNAQIILGPPLNAYGPFPLYNSIRRPRLSVSSDTSDSMRRGRSTWSFFPFSNRDPNSLSSTPLLNDSVDHSPRVDYGGLTSRGRNRLSDSAIGTATRASMIWPRRKSGFYDDLKSLTVNGMRVWYDDYTTIGAALPLVVF
ncbi:hypothetical protein BDK51DRAFT_40964 [Blyttiomyces helicus]|uniref:Uncharacterized protein n=1 Tax=Blyttiomyces helicus TaxID=388810 RepID=A0A4P9WAP4_9FUNG|nr:hypothetical protein BDK51DRAFT_40964 [Blyttiomyces helicus]|eukprot:RKO87316.1 hypothetical protein BDK51DRAFT_40964 [Blyttiomyces helicus]